MINLIDIPQGFIILLLVIGFIAYGFYVITKL